MSVSFPLHELFPSWRTSQQRLRGVAGGAILGSLLALAGCTTPAPEGPAAPVETPVTSSPTPAATTSPEATAGPEATRPTGRGRWVRADWNALPGWNEDSLTLAWPALLRSCERVGPPPAALQPVALNAAPASVFQVAWAPVCDAARAIGPGADEARIRQFLTSRLQPWRVEGPAGQVDGLMTGYFEPLIEASRVRTARQTVPLYAPPADLATRKPWYTRAQIETLPAALDALRGKAIAWIADPLDATLVQVQGSGRLMLTEPDGRKRMVRLAYAANNDHPFVPLSRWLVQQGAFTLEQANWPAIRDWARAHPQRVRELVNVNPRYVFFREEPLPDPTIGAVGAQGVPLTPGRSIAVDKESIPYGTPVWLASTEPQPWSLNPPPARPLQRLVVAQDTGSAIVGAVRADYYWGWGDGAEDRAGRTKQPLRLWALWPR
ncbi:murein transglycosylase A [Leptothrix discophora]